MPVFGRDPFISDYNDNWQSGNVKSSMDSKQNDEFFYSSSWSCECVNDPTQENKQENYSVCDQYCPIDIIENMMSIVVVVWELTH